MPRRVDKVELIGNTVEGVGLAYRLSLIVIPRSRSSSIVSRCCSCKSRSETTPVRAMMRSASVDLPWSTCAMMQKLRIWDCEVGIAGMIQSYRRRVSCDSRASR